MSTDLPFWLDWDYDRANADAGTASRYDNYLRLRSREFEYIDYDDPTVAFAVEAWRTATGPVMSPPLVRRDERVCAALLSRSYWDGQLAAEVTLVAPTPSGLRSATSHAGAYYRVPPAEGITEEDTARRPYLSSTVQLLIPMGWVKLPKLTAVPSSHKELFAAAHACVGVLVDALNAEVGPLLDQIGTTR